MSRRILPAALLLLLGACEQSATAPRGALSASEAAELAARMDEVGTGFSSALFISPSLNPVMDVIAGTHTFQRTTACPGGGTVAVDGTLSLKVDATARSGSYTLAATSVAASCVLPRRDGGTFTLTSTPSTTVTAAQSFNAGVPGPRTATQKGSFTWTRDGKSGSCAVDLASTFDPGTRTATVKGTFCGQAVDVTRTQS